MKKIRIIAALCGLLMLCSCGNQGISDETPAAPVTTAAATETEDSTPAAEETEAKESIFDAPTDGFQFTQAAVCTNTIKKNAYKAMFEKCAASEITVPALEQYFVPQGMDCWEEEGVLIVSGYFNPQDVYAYSVLFAVDIETGKYVGEWKLYNTDGQPHSGHDGGVAVTENDIYLSTSSKLFRISLDSVRNTGNQGDLKIEEEIAVPVRASYCNYSNGILWVGEFSLQGNASYTITGHDFGGNHAWTLGYKTDAEGKLEKTPSYCVSTPEKIQGFTVLEDGSLFMTCSYGRTNTSVIYVNSGDFLSGEAAGNVTVSGKSVPIYLPTCEKITAIPMTEGCCAVGNAAYILFESGAYYYRDMTSSKATDPTDKIWVYNK